MLLLMVLLLVHVVVVHVAAGHLTQAVHAAGALAPLHGILGEVVLRMAVVASSAAVDGIVGAGLGVALFIPVSFTLALGRCCCLCRGLLGQIFA